MRMAARTAKMPVQILELIDDLRQRLRMSVVLVTHDLAVIAGRANRVAVMYAGKIVETTDTATMFANPRHPYTEALFHALPDQAAETRERLYSIPGAPPDLMRPPKGRKVERPAPLGQRKECDEQQCRPSVGHHHVEE